MYNASSVYKYRIPKTGLLTLIDIRFMSESSRIATELGSISDVGELNVLVCLFLFFLDCCTLHCCFVHLIELAQPKGYR